MVNDMWKDIGFQGKNPRTDFRGGGFMGLACLIYFLEEYPQEFEEMIACTKNESEKFWLTAVSSINVTFNLLIFLDMHSG
jgi:hypothetical protein